MKPFRLTLFSSLATILTLLTLILCVSNVAVYPVSARPIPLASPTVLGGRILAQVVADIAVFRTGPSRQYPIITRVKRLNKIELSGISEDSAWYMFIYDNKATWISGDKTITQLILGDPSFLPVIHMGPTPTPRATSNAPAYDPISCKFDDNMSDEAQDALVLQMTNALTANDWHQVGIVAHRLYLCPMNGVFYVLYTQDVQTKLAQGTQALDQGTASTLFQQGWAGQ
jgi:hypothetical protein